MSGPYATRFLAGWACLLMPAACVALLAGGGVTGCRGLSQPLVDDRTAPRLTALEGRLELVTAVGGQGGAPFALSCAPAGVVVGVFGGAGAVVDSIGLRCWDPSSARFFETEKIGGAGGRPYAVACEPGSEVMGFATGHGAVINWLAPQCKQSPHAAEPAPPALEPRDDASPSLREIARTCIVAMIPAELVDLSDPDDVRLWATTLGEAYGLCDGQRFAEQPTAAACSGTLIDDDLRSAGPRDTRPGCGVGPVCGWLPECSPV